MHIPTTLRGAICVGMVWLALSLPGPEMGAAAPAGETAARPDLEGRRPDAVTLEYQEVGEPLMNWGLSLDPQTLKFKSEPDFGPRTVVRSQLTFGGDRGASIPFAWDRSQAKLYLDLNRNLDLTDDADGVFTCARKGYYQTFTNVHLEFKTASGTRPVLVDLNLAAYEARPTVHAALRSFWQGKIRLQGQDWQVGVVESVAGQIKHSHLLLRPWENRHERFSLMDGSLDAFAFPNRLFLLNQAYQVTCHTEPAGNPPKLKLEFTEQPAKLGELKLAGTFLKRVILEPGDYTVVLDTPPPVVRVPVGTYEQHRVSVQSGELKAYRHPNSPAGLGRLMVSEEKAAGLRLGGPLTNAVSVARRTKQLVFSYQLLGADGMPYQLANPNQGRSKPPEFSVYQGEKQIATGVFEFG